MEINFEVTEQFNKSFADQKIYPEETTCKHAQCREGGKGGTRILTIFLNNSRVIIESFKMYKIKHHHLQICKNLIFASLYFAEKIRLLYFNFNTMCMHLQAKKVLYMEVFFFHTVSFMIHNERH